MQDLARWVYSSYQNNFCDVLAELSQTGASLLITDDALDPRQIVKSAGHRRRQMSRSVHQHIKSEHGKGITGRLTNIATLGEAENVNM